jgi:hypothetical protein
MKLKNSSTSNGGCKLLEFSKLKNSKSCHYTLTFTIKPI